jgi:muramidase (phage lysozyme)
MARAPVRDVSGPAELRGVAAPVNTYVRPADPERSSLHDLADGLAALDSGLGAFMGKRKEKADEAAKERAIRDAYMGKEAEWDAGVKRGLIPPQDSPVYMEWYNKTKGDVQGRKLRDKFNVAYLQWDGRNGGDPEAFNQFVQTFIRENVAEDVDPQILAGLNPHIDDLFTEGYGAFTSDRADKVYSESVANSGALIHDTVERVEAESRATGEDIDKDALWNSIMENRAEATKRVLEKDYDAYMVEAIIQQAEESGNPDLLGLLEKTLPGEKHPLSYDVKVREKRDAALARIENAQASKATTEYTIREREEKKLQEDNWSKVVRIIAEDPNAEVPEELIQQLSRREGDARAKIANYRKQFSDAGVLEDPEAVAQVFADIHTTSATEKDVIEWYKKGVIKDKSTLTAALDRVEKLRKSRADGGGLLTSATADSWKRQFQNLTGTDSGNMFEGTMVSDETRQAFIDFDVMLMDWEERHPDASRMEREEAINKAGAIIRQRITEERQYNSPQEAEALKAQAAVEEMQKATTPEAQAEEEAPETSLYNYVTDFLFGGGEEEPGEVATPEEGTESVPTLDTLSEPRRAAVEALAKKHGISSEEANIILQQRLKGLGVEPDPGVDPTITNSIPEETRSSLENLLKNPPAAAKEAASHIPVAPLLNLIGKTEGTDKGDGYNETLAYGKFTDGDVNLVGMTLDEVDSLQTQMLRHPDNNWNSSAIGRYQIIRTTLRGLREEMGLTGNERFDQKLQDRMALHLLKRRGLDKWQAGQMSDEEFIGGLSAEWASLPKADGKGTYRGQRVGTSVGGLKNTLRQVQVASLDPSAGFPKDIPRAYSKIPATDDRGEDQIAKFLEWNPDPVGNHEANLATLPPQLQDVVRRAQEVSGVKFVIGSAARDDAMQQKAKEWGWSKTDDSDHEHGQAVDLWPLDEDGAVVFDKKLQTQIVKAMKQAAKELGIKLDIGADWKGFKDLPHFALKS